MGIKLKILNDSKLARLLNKRLFEKHRESLSATIGSLLTTWLSPSSENYF